MRKLAAWPPVPVGRPLVPVASLGPTVEPLEWVPPEPAPPVELDICTVTGMTTVQDMGPMDGMMDGARQLKKGAIWRKIAAAAGIGGAAAAAGYGASQVGGGDDGEGRTDMAAMILQRNGGRADMAALQERDAIVKKAQLLEPQVDFTGMNPRQVLETLYKEDKEVKDLPTQRLRGRLDMEVASANDARQYLQADGQGNTPLPQTIGAGGSIGLALRKLQVSMN